MPGQKPGGIGLLYDPLVGHVVETHTSTCAHCQTITEFPSLRVMHEYVDVCRTCMRLICDKCATRMAQGQPCTPWEKQLEYMEARLRFFRDMGMT